MNNSEATRPVCVHSLSPRAALRCCCWCCSLTDKRRRHREAGRAAEVTRSLSGGARTHVQAARVPAGAHFLTPQVYLVAVQQASPAPVLIRFLEEPHRVSQFKLNLFSVSVGGLNLNRGLSTVGFILELGNLSLSEGEGRRMGPRLYPGSPSDGNSGFHSYINTHKQHSFKILYPANWGLQKPVVWKQKNLLKVQLGNIPTVGIRLNDLTYIFGVLCISPISHFR